MGIADKMKEMLGQNADKAKDAVDKAGDTFDQKTGGKYADKVDMAQEKAKEFIDGNKSGTGERPAPADPAQPQ